MFLKRKLKKLNEVLKVQGNDGNWNSDEYMLGYFNGLELATSIMENREPIFRKLKKED